MAMATTIYSTKHQFDAKQFDVLERNLITVMFSFGPVPGFLAIKKDFENLLKRVGLTLVWFENFQGWTQLSNRKTK